MFVNNEWCGTKSWIVCDNKGYSYRLVSVRVSLVASASERAMSFTPLISLWVEEGQIVSTFVEISFELVGTECERLVRRTNTSKSES